MRRFEEIGFPGPKNEDWKYTRVTPILAHPFHAALGNARRRRDREAVERRIAALALPADAVRLGVRRRDVRARAFGSIARREDGIVAEPRGRSRVDRFARCGRGSAAASMRACTASPRSTRPSPRTERWCESLRASIRSDAGSSRVRRHRGRGRCCRRYRRSEISSCASQGSASTLIEHWLGEPGLHLTNAATEIVLEKGATLRHVKVQDEGAGCLPRRADRGGLGRVERARFLRGHARRARSRAPSSTCASRAAAPSAS